MTICSRVTLEACPGLFGKSAPFAKAHCRPWKAGALLLALSKTPDGMGTSITPVPGGLTPDRDRIQTEPSP
jgi:hypothetical protein